MYIGAQCTFVLMPTSRIPIDPKLPARFDSTPNDERPTSHLRWLNRPFIQTYTAEQQDAYMARIGGQSLELWLRAGRADWLEHWPSGTRYDVRCLDGGAWDRSTFWGAFGTLDEALECCQNGPSWRGDLDRQRACPVCGARLPTDEHFASCKARGVARLLSKGQP